MLLLSTLALLALSELPTLGDLVRGADRIVEGEVVVLHSVLQGGEHVPRRYWPEDEILVAEVRVSRVLLGPPELKRTFVVGARVEDGGLVRALREGEKALFFLDVDRLFWVRASKETNARLAAVTEDEQLHKMHRVDALVFSANGWASALAAMQRVRLPEELRATGGIGREALLAWVDRRLGEVTPSLWARECTTGPYPWSVKVEADGAWTVRAPRPLEPAEEGDWRRGDHAGRLNLEELAELHSAVDEEFFFTLPRDIGWAPAPDSVFRFFELRTRRGVKRVRLHPVGEPDVKGRAHLERLWKALPGEGRPPHLR